MTWVRYFAKKVFRRFDGAMSAETANKYMNVMRMLYFLSASTLGIYVWNNFKEDDRQDLESGRPVIKDLSEGHRVLRTSGAHAGMIYTYDLNTGTSNKMEFNKDEYLQLIEKQAFERAKKAQEEAIAEGRELPADAIRLVE